MSRPSLEFHQEQERLLETSNSIKARFEQTNAQLRLTQNPIEFNKLNSEESGIDFEDNENRDPAIISANLVVQTQFLRKLKFQYLEQNAKDRYVKSIVSDIDDAPIVTAEDVKDLSATNEEKKAKLKAAKNALAEMDHNIRTLTPLVQDDYDKTKAAIDKATALAQKIIDARLALTRLRQTHPHPRLTIASADQKLADQVTEMQEFSDQVEVTRRKVQNAKEELKTGNVELESLRAERSEAEKLVKNANVGEDDPRIAPLYDWFTASLLLHRTVQDLHEIKSVSDNELRLTYKLDPSRHIKITLIFLPDTRQLATVDISGFEGDFTEVVDSHLQTNDIHGLIGAVLARARRS
ncbi:hypothetical protein P691DRAFT_670074 [Macrolepiota fuliginosa MF-IS2]|uniref:Kinetochore protein Sos7 coiled-coil domain-containing protein n=1 Tax=Macrolepiota fuliginosa MF-IS2 TaxID=1400762 RepID=A0A9P5XCF1_9AGAR|nr:hypothetical protein P691DRAFT_670074 [Macrolepiota fuliginosa MF-IS2]